MGEAVATMVIIEGPHSCGKTTLANQLSVDLQLPVRSVSGDHRGRGDFLLEKVTEDLRKWPDPRLGTGIYDTYPLIDEYIYGPLHRSRVSEGFDTSAMKPLMEFFFEQSCIIYCRPPDELIEDPAVTYYDFILRFPLTLANVQMYDYTDRFAYRRILTMSRIHYRTREGLAS